MQTCIYTLPELTFVAGDVQELSFRLLERDKSLYNANHCEGNFAICNYSNKIGTPLVSIQPTFISGEEADYKYIFHVVIPTWDTIDLYGKYIYQLTIKDDTGRYEVPNHGIMNITRNINQPYFTTGKNNIITRKNGFIMLPNE